MNMPPRKCFYGEARIIWLHPKDNYAYLREGIMHCHFRQRFPLKKFDPAKYTDGGPLSHIVAYAVLLPDVMPWEAHLFARRYWWVKGYDRFDGHGTHNGDWYKTGAPIEAVNPWTIIANHESEGYEPED